MTAPQWRPDDTELDAVARSLEADEPTHARAEQLRTSVLAAAAGRPQRSRRSVVPFAVAGLALAAAAAVVLWVATRQEPSPAVAIGARQVITPIGSARFERASDWPDYVVHLDDGRIDVQVVALAADERFRVTTRDAEVEVRGARFEVGADRDRLMTVLVKEGRAELRVSDQQVVVLSAGESWSATKTAQREELVAPVKAPVTPPEPPITPPAVPPAPTRGAKAGTVAALAPARPVVPSTDTPAPAPSSNPGEAEFRAGWAALRAGDAGAAAKAFATACHEAMRAALGEDACFWAGAAAKRAGDAAIARGALEQFLAMFPSSSRAAEASALLGWLLYDAGELDAADRLFHQAEHDRVPKVRESAQRGLTAIQRTRHTP